MPSRSNHPRLSERDREILRDVVHTYVLTAEPVSSRTVAKHDHSLSAASIRNIMADLDDLGYLVQPHTSAGRVPTPLGYHLFIDDLMTAEAPSEEERRLIDDALSGIGDVEGLAQAATELLSHLSRRVGMVTTPAMGSTELRAMEFVPLSDRRVLCITVTTTGFVDNKVIEAQEELDREQLLRISNYVTENFSGLTMAEIRARLIALMEDERARMDALLGQAIDLVGRGLSGRDRPEVLYDGAQALLAEPELCDLERVRKLFDTFSDKAQLVGMLDQCMQGQGVRVWIGTDSDLTSELDFSLIFRDYRIGDRPVGGVALFGPSRSQYAKLIPLVDYLGERLSAALEDTL